MERNPQCEILHPPLAMSVWMPPLYAYHSHEEMRGTDQDKSIVRLISLSEHVVGCVMGFRDTCRKGCLFSHIDKCRAYNTPEGR